MSLDFLSIYLYTLYDVNLGIFWTEIIENV